VGGALVTLACLLVRGELWRRLEDEMAPEYWHMLQQIENEEKAYKLLDFDFLGGSVLAGIVAPRVCVLAGRSVGRFGMRRSTLMSAGPTEVMLWYG
jgi:hypothetical protein